MSRQEAAERYQLAMRLHAGLGDAIRVLGLTPDQIAAVAEVRGAMESSATRLWRQFADREHAA